MDVRTPAALLVLVAVGGGLWWVASLAPDASGIQAGTHAVWVVAPDGAVLANGTVSVPEATPLSVLLALGEAAGFTVGHEEMAGFDACSRHYVRAIGPHAQTTTGGWNYYTRRDGGDWTWQPAGAGCGLPAGVDVEWCWVEADVCRHHAP